VCLSLYDALKQEGMRGGMETECGTVLGGWIMAAVIVGMAMSCAITPLSSVDIVGRDF